MKSVALLSLACASSAYIFKPEAESNFENTHIPSLVNYTESQYERGLGSSYWLSSFITGKNRNQYLAISHLLWSEAVAPVCRASVLDLTTLEYWVDLSYCTFQGESTYTAEGLFLADFDTYAFGATSQDAVASQFAYAKPANKSFEFDLKWNTSSKVLPNGGGGKINFGFPVSNTTQWSIPASKTDGTLTLNGTTIEIDTKNSFTWYDRQISYGTPKNWTWFELHFPGSSIKASIWAWDLGSPSNTVNQFATVRVGESVQILAFELKPDAEKTWTSPNSNITYPLKWTLEFENGDTLVAESVRADQEMYGSHSLVDTAYEGFVKISGKFLGQRTGYGVVELVHVREE